MNKIDKEAQRIANEWNRRFKIGQDVVVCKNFEEKGTVTKTRSEAQVVCGSAVVWCEGIAGCYALSHITPI